MTRDETKAVVLRLLGEIAPEADLGALHADENMRDQLDLDSMDFLNFLTAVSAELGIEIPEVDYGDLATLDGCVTYLAARA